MDANEAEKKGCRCPDGSHKGMCKRTPTHLVLHDIPVCEFCIEKHVPPHMKTSGRSKPIASH